MIDLKKIEDRIDETLENETRWSLTVWFIKYRVKKLIRRCFK